ASIATQGLLGDKMIQVSVGNPGVPELKDGDTLKTKKESLSLEDLGSKGGELLENVNTLVKDIREKEGLAHALIYDEKGKEIVGNLSQVTRSAQNMLRQVQSGDGMLHQFIYKPADPNLTQNLSTAVDNMKKTTQNLKDVTGRIEKGEG